MVYQRGEDGSGIASDKGIDHHAFISVDSRVPVSLNERPALQLLENELNVRVKILQPADVSSKILWFSTGRGLRNRWAKTLHDGLIKNQIPAAFRSQGIIRLSVSSIGQQSLPPLLMVAVFPLHCQYPSAVAQNMPARQYLFNAAVFNYMLCAWVCWATCPWEVYFTRVCNFMPKQPQRVEKPTWFCYGQKNIHIFPL